MIGGLPSKQLFMYAFRYIFAHKHVRFLHIDKPSDHSLQLNFLRIKKNRTGVIPFLTSVIQNKQRMNLYNTIVFISIDKHILE